MRRFFAPAVLVSTIWLFAGGAATAQDGITVETRPGSTTWLGDTGLWFVPTGEILPDGKWSISGYRANLDRAQGLTDISHFIGTFGVGLGDRVEVFGSVRADTRIRRAARPLFNPTDPTNGGIQNDYPLVTDFWSDDHIGDVIVGAKFNIASEHRMQPAALALRAAVKAPTGNEETGQSSGKADFMVDFIASKNVGKQVEVSGFGGLLVRGEPSGFTLGHSIRWGFGAGFPTGGTAKLFTEVRGEVPLENNTILASPLRGIDTSVSPLSSTISAPLDFTAGLQWQSRRGAFVGVGVSYAINQDKGLQGTTGNILGLQVRLGRHPGVRRYVEPPPPPPPPPAPPANRSPTVTTACNPCEVQPGETSTLTANANDPDSDSLTYRWSTPTGILSPSDQMTTTWTAPAVDGPVPVIVTVDDGRGGTASDTATIRVVSPPPPPAREYNFEDVHFDFDRFSLRPGAVRILDEAISAMNEDADLNLTIQGHTCNIGTSEYNQALGERRATGVRDYLSSRGIAANRLQTVTFGEERPLHDNAREETRRLNRRAAITVRLQ
jgi:outer membrane protein OmpA-like peptidoglycan-associated protein